MIHYQNEYFSTTSAARDLPGEFACKLPDAKEPSPMSPQTKHMYQQKLTLQRINYENHLREFSRIQGYQNHPKYQEYLMKYRENLRMQQSLEHQYQASLQQQQQAQPPPPPAPSLPPINLQFDQNGVLINSSLIPGYNPSMQSGMPGMPNPMSPKDPSNPFDGESFSHYLSRIRR